VGLLGLVIYVRGMSVVFVSEPDSEERCAT
jgi:hypothetical protein